MIQNGTVEFLYQEQEKIFVFRRVWENQELFVMNNLSGQIIQMDEIGKYGRNNTRRTGGVCDLDSCNGLYNTIWIRAIIFMEE